MADGRGGVAARATESVEVSDAGLVLRAVGYRGAPLPGVPFDERRGTIANEAGLWEGLRERGVRVVGFDGWQAIDAYERGLGEPQGRPRVKLVRREQLIERALTAVAPGGGL